MAFRMKLTTNILSLIPVLCLLAACGQTKESLPTTDPLIAVTQTNAPTDTVVYPDDRPSIPDGKLVYEKMNCASCHGADGSTKIKVAEADTSLSDFLFMSKKKPVNLYKQLTYGKQDQHHMQGKISPKETWNLVFYTKALGCPPLTQGEVDEINAVFGSNCAVCHGTKGDGDGPLARNLEPMPANFQTFRRFYDRTDDTLFDHIANGIKWEGMPNFLGKEDKKKNVKFDHAYIKKLVQYVRNFHVSNVGTAVASATPAEADKASSSDKAAPAAESKAPEASPPKAGDAASTEAPKTGETAATGASGSPDSAAKTEEKKTDASATDTSAATSDPSKVTNDKTEDKSH